MAETGGRIARRRAARTSEPRRAAFASLAASTGEAQDAGRMFWFIRKRLPASYFAFTCVSRG